MTNKPGVLTHPTVVTRDSESIALIMAALHDLRENKEFGNNAGKSAILV